MRLILGSNARDDAGDIRIGWDSIPARFPLVSSFDSVVVYPEKGTADQQAVLIKNLGEQLALTRKTPTIVWILNEHSIAAVAESTGSGRLVALHAPQVSEVVSLLVDRESAQVYFGFSQLALGAMPIAHLGILGKGRVIVGAVSPDEKWLLVPPTTIPQLTEWRKLQRARFTLAGMLLLPLILAALFLLLAQSRNAVQFSKAVSDLWSTPSAHSIASARLLSAMEREWQGAEPRMVARILSSESFFGLAEISSSLNPGRSSFDLFRRRAETVPPDAYFDLALISGDGGSAYRIAQELTSNDEEYQTGWITLARLTSTFWQTSIESLHELNLRRSEAYLQLYLATAYRVPDPSEFDYEDRFVPSRIKTLAQILQREFENGNVKSLCAKPGVERSFGRLNGPGLQQDYGYRLPSDDDIKGLRERRDFFGPKFCPKNRVFRQIDYDKLAILQRLNNRKALTILESTQACQIAQLECEYMAIRRRLEPDHPDSNSAIRDMLAFARWCSYLSDDAVADVLDSIPYVISLRPHERIDVRSFDEACRCFNQVHSDYRGYILGHLDDAKCEWFDWENSEAEPLDFAGISQLQTKCTSLQQKSQGGGVQ